jgi:hypothetical protein
VVGAAIGVLPALFTFGLSIPVGAAIGGGAGACGKLIWQWGSPSHRFQKNMD